MNEPPGYRASFNNLVLKAKDDELQPACSEVAVNETRFLAPRYAPASINCRESVQVVASLYDPQITVYSQFISPLACNELIALAGPRLTPSMVVTSGASGESTSTLSHVRRSMTAAFRLGETALIEYIEQKIAAVTATEVSQGEGFCILKYSSGDEYLPHLDYFNHSAPDLSRRADGGNRIATLIIYLNDVEGGGGTDFPKLGFRVSPIRGNACLFGYMTENGMMDIRTLHAGTPVVSGEKWVAVKWLHQTSRCV